VGDDEPLAQGDEPAVPAAVTLARVVRDLTQEQLSAKTGISQAFVSKVERGSVELSGDRLAAVAAALEYPVGFFLVDPWGKVAQTACVFPRKRNSLATSVEKRVRGLLQVTRMQVESVVGDVAPEVRLERRDPEDADWISPTEMAASVRAAAGIPCGPIPNLTAFLEQLGVLVIVRDLGSRRLDALGQWPDGGRPLVLLNSSGPVDRRRFTASHELGHAVLHTAPTEQQEAEADEFAAALLMPPADGRAALREISLPKLAELKKTWGMSMAALIRRARDLGTINDYRYRQLNIELSAAGYKMSEPVPLPDEPPTAVPALLSRLTSEGRTVAELAASARMTEREFQDVYMEAAS
jgi:Zn-dependent peptidase ImmA (M78 family)/transcriptional regulator with XRE-family HTH domain